MKKKLLNLLGILFFLSFVSLNAQTFYYYKGEKINLTVDRNYVYIIADDEFTKSSSANQSTLNFNLEFDDNKPAKGLVKLRLKSVSEMSEYLKLVESLRQNEQIKHVFPFFERGNATPPIGTSDIFYVKIKEIRDSTLLRKTAEQQNVQIVKQVPYMPQWYILSIRNSTLQNSVSATNYFYETGYFEDVDPAFMFNFRANCTNDPMFNQLWGLKNTSYPGIDIDACNAWTITRGAGAKVAVVDQPIDRNHNDLAANILSVFDTQNGTSLYDPTTLLHGTHVCGTIAAIKDNNLQVVGVAPESKIMGISHDLYISPTISAELASGISWAWQNGADVITNSWGDQGGRLYNELQSSILDNAIVNAMTQGRGGKGSVVVFAAGNFPPVMDYPANSNDDILTVGSINSNGIRSSFSGYGTKLDVVAPGNGILSTIPNNGTETMSGTSMATPHVAGIAALVLSINPTLTRQQVRNIIESTCQKVYQYSSSNPSGYTYSITSGRPNGTWNNEMGYGLVNAFAAVQATCPTPILNFTTQIVTTDTTVTNCGDINMQNVTVTNGAILALKAVGNINVQGVTVNNNSKLILEAGGEVNIISDFDVQLDSEFEIKYP